MLREAGAAAVACRTAAEEGSLEAAVPAVGEEVARRADAWAVAVERAVARGVMVVGKAAWQVAVWVAVAARWEESAEAARVAAAGARAATRAGLLEGGAARVVGSGEAWEADLEPDNRD